LYTVFLEPSSPPKKIFRPTCLPPRPPEAENRIEILLNPVSNFQKFPLQGILKTIIV